MSAPAGTRAAVVASAGLKSAETSAAATPAEAALPRFTFGTSGADVSRRPLVLAFVKMAVKLEPSVE